MKEKQVTPGAFRPDNLHPQAAAGKQAEIFNPGNQVVVNLTKEAQGTMHYRAQR